MRPRVELVIDRFDSEGFKPCIYYAWRSLAVQCELVSQGRSQVGFGLHNAQYPDGRPRAFAIDIIDRRWAWAEAARENGFRDALGRAGRDEGLYWGGSWVEFKDYAYLHAFPNTRLAEIRRLSGPA